MSTFFVANLVNICDKTQMAIQTIYNFDPPPGEVSDFAVLHL